MNRIRSFRSALVALVPLAAIAFGGVALAQTPAATPTPAPQATPAPAATPEPSATPAPSAQATPAPAATPAPVASPSAAPSPPPATAQTPASPSPAPTVQTADPFGEQFSLEPKKVVVMKGTANWDTPSTR